jgi:Trk K+ transport system NAD-binding subunit
MRHIVVGSTHFSAFILKAIREADPGGIIYTVERSPEVAEIMSKQINGKAVHGLLTDPATLENAGIKIADTFFALTDSDALNANLVELSKKIYSVPLVVAISNNPENAEILYKSGANYVLSPVENITNEVKSLLSIDRPSLYPLPTNMGVDLIIMRPVNTLGILSTIISMLSNQEDVKDLIALSPSDGKMKNPEETERGDFFVLVVRKISSNEILKKVEELIKKSYKRGN